MGVRYSCGIFGKLVLHFLGTARVFETVGKDRGNGRACVYV